MFDLWVIRTIKRTTNDKIKRYGLVFKSNIKCFRARIKGREKEAESELRDTYLVKERKPRKIERAKRVGNGARPKKTPNVVFIPFPPLKPAKMGKIWPNMAKRPANMGKSSGGRSPE